MPLGLPPGPVHLVMGKGRLILLHSAGVAAFNVSAHKVMLPGSYLVSHTWQHLWRLYGLSQQHQQLQQKLEPAAQHASAAGDSAPSDAGGDSDVPSGSTGDSTGYEGDLHSAAWGSSLTAATATPGLLVLPFGERGIAVFGQGRGSAVGSLGGGAAAAGGAISGSSGGGGSGPDVNWVKMLQPFVVVMMIIIGVWQFVRASNRSNLSSVRAARYGAGMGALGDMGYLSRSQGLAGSYMPMGGEELLGGQRRPAWAMGDDDELLSSLDRELGPYVGPRSRRDREPGGALGALTARRRARAAMFSGRHSEREQSEREHVAGAASLRRRGLAAALTGQGAGGRYQYERQEPQSQSHRAGRASSANRPAADSIPEEGGVEEDGYDAAAVEQQSTAAGAGLGDAEQHADHGALQSAVQEDVDSDSHQQDEPAQQALRAADEQE